MTATDRAALIQLHERALAILKAGAAPSPSPSTEELASLRFDRLAAYCDHMRREGVELHEPRSGSGFNHSVIARMADVYPTDIRAWLQGKKRTGSAVDTSMECLFRSADV
jgi:hypothetical protein